MKYILALVVVIFTFFIQADRVFAQSKDLIYSPVTPTPTLEYAFPYPGILPDHPLYFLKAARDRILLFFTYDHVKRTNLNLLLADKRLVMGQLLSEKGNTDLSTSTFSKAEKYLLSATLELGILKKQNSLPPGLADKVELAAKKHEEVISRLMGVTADENKLQNLSGALGVNHQAIQQIKLLK